MAARTTPTTSEEAGMHEGNPYFGATFAERKAARLGAASAEKAVKADDVEDKAVSASETKARPRKPTTRKKG